MPFFTNVISIIGANSDILIVFYIKGMNMIKCKILLPILFLLWACNDQIKGFDDTNYDLYKESQFANGFALIKDQYGKRLDPHHNEKKLCRWDYECLCYVWRNGFIKNKKTNYC